VAAAINLLSDEHGVVATNTAGVLSLNSVAGTEIKIDMEGTATALTTGLLATNNSSSRSTVADLNLSTQAGAQSAISIIDTALEQINSSRSELGAINNRLDFTVSNLMNVSENTAAARSRIVDADYAAETANLSRAQVLQQAASAMLAQANAAPQQVLSLLR
jgi:flagellin